jgi:hypothetical protein
MSAVNTQKRAEPAHTLFHAAIYNINKVCVHRSVKSCASFRPDLTDRCTRARFVCHALLIHHTYRGDTIFSVPTRLYDVIDIIQTRRPPMVPWNPTVISGTCGPLMGGRLAFNSGVFTALRD